MPRKIFIRPLDGRKIDDPMTDRRIPETGTTVDDSPFWRARRKAGEIAIEDPPAAAEIAKPTPTATRAVAEPPAAAPKTSAKDEARSAQKGSK